MKVILSVMLAAAFALAFAGYSHAELTHVAVINDADGFTNVREGKSAQTEVVGQIDEEVRFLVEPSADSWWLVRTTDGMTGYMHKSRVRVLGMVAESSKPAADRDATASPAKVFSSSVTPPLEGHFSPGFPPPSAGASSSEKFLYQLHGITMSYYLAAAYQTSVGNDVYTDAHWALGRGIAVQKLLESELASEVPSSIRGFCAGAIQLDRALQVVARASQNAGPAAVDDAREIFIRGMTNSSQQESGNPLLQMLGNAMLRASEVHYMAQTLLRTKQQGDFHREWENLLSGWAAREPALQPYASDPQFTDATWHFMRAEELGDVFPGETASTRGPRQLYINRPARSIYVGDLSDGPILLRVNKRGSFNWEISFNMVPGFGPIVQAECSRGHFGYQLNSLSTWAARGLSDFHRGGRIDRSAPRYGKWGGRHKIQIYHVKAGTNGDEDDISDGTLLIYHPDQAGSDDEARKIASVVEL